MPNLEVSTAPSLWQASRAMARFLGAMVVFTSEGTRHLWAGVEGRGHLVIAEALLLLIPWPVVPQLGLQGWERS